MLTVFTANELLNDVVTLEIKSVGLDQCLNSNSVASAYVELSRGKKNSNT